VVRFCARERSVCRLQIAKTGSGVHPFDRYKKLFFLGEKSLKDETDCFPPYSAVVENQLSCTSTSKRAFSSYTEMAFPLVAYIKRTYYQQSVVVSCRRTKYLLLM
jgi:hypothetical protein